MLARACQRGIGGIGRLGSGSAEETLESTAEVEEGSGDHRTQALEEQEAGSGIDVRMGLALAGAAERDKKHGGEESQLKSMSHGTSFHEQGAKLRGVVNGTI
jgi:hypothetical protein